MKEFKVFIAELRDFFNAAGLTSLLEEVKRSIGDEDKQVGQHTIAAQRSAQLSIHATCSTQQRSCTLCGFHCWMNCSTQWLVAHDPPVV